jgi:hypothetical protein
MGQSSLLPPLSAVDLESILFNVTMIYALIFINDYLNGFNFSEICISSGMLNSNLVLCF